MRRNLIISGGIFHPFDESSKALAETLCAVGIESKVTNDVNAGLAELAKGSIDMLTINALRWGMMTADKYEPYRDEWAFQIPRDSRDYIVDFVRSGGALLGLHTASICFDDWQEWGEILGAYWRWGVSYHPPLGVVSIEPTNVSHEVIRDISRFELNDEIYHNLKLQADAEPLLMGRCSNGDKPQPVCWSRNFGDGRVVYDALGHNAESIQHPQHGQLLRQAACWLLQDG